MAQKDFRQVVHDLRNCIAPIRNVVYLIRMRGTGDQKLADATGIIDRQIDAMSRLLDEVSASGVTACEESATLPGKVSAASTGSAREPDSATGARSLRILIADDSTAVCESFAAILRDLGHEVRAAYDGLQAVEAATAWMPDFVLLDVNMPKLNGYEAARRLRAQFPSSKMRLVMISGMDIDSGVLEAARQAGFDRCLDKLLDFAALRRMLEE